MLYSVKVIRNSTQKNQFKQVFFVIKKKVCKKAVDRNRIKRIARNAYRDALKESLKCVEKELEGGIIFFLERDMIQEDYSHIVQKMSQDIVNIIKKQNNLN